MERQKNLSLHPIPYREALRDLLKVKPEPKVTNKKATRQRKRQAKKKP